MILALYVWSSYNSMVRLSLAADQQWAQVESQYQRRFDLVPNLEAQVKGSMKQESAVFVGIANARSQYAGARTTNEKVAAAGAYDSALSRLLAVVESYPTLKSSDLMMSFMASLEGTENRIAVERMRYNETVTAYNQKISLWPASMLANMLGFDNRSLFQADKGAEKAPKVNFE